MNAASGKQEPVFDLIRSMSKAEKRNFKLYATRLSGNQEAKFVTLFDCMDSLDEYDEAKILQRCPIKKEQLPNMKAHLYKQILVSIRLLDVQRTVPMQLREQIDFARILYDKGLFRQSSKMLDKAKETALANEQYTAAIDIIDFRKKMDTLSVAGESCPRARRRAGRPSNCAAGSRTSTSCRTPGCSFTPCTFSWVMPGRRRTWT